MIKASNVLLANFITLQELDYILYTMVQNDKMTGIFGKYFIKILSDPPTFYVSMGIVTRLLLIPERTQ